MDLRDDFLDDSKDSYSSLFLLSDSELDLQYMKVYYVKREKQYSQDVFHRTPLSNLCGAGIHQHLDIRHSAVIFCIYTFRKQQVPKQNKIRAMAIETRSDAYFCLQVCWSYTFVTYTPWLCLEVLLFLNCLIPAILFETIPLLLTVTLCLFIVLFWIYISVARNVRISKYWNECDGKCGEKKSKSENGERHRKHLEKQVKDEKELKK